MNALSLSLLCLLFAGGEAPPDLPITIERVGVRVVVANFASNNVTAIATEQGVIIVDSHRSPTIMRAILSRFADDLERSDWRWLVNTHGHWDHTWGNQSVEGATRMGHARCAEYIEAFGARRRLTQWRQESALKELRSEVQKMAKGSEAYDRLAARLVAQEVIVDDLHEGFVPTPPEETFEDRVRIDGGDVTAELIFCGAAHTDHDVFVFVPEERLLLTGDVFCSERSLCFAVDALTDGERLLGVIDDVLARAPDELTVIPGHGDVMNREALVRLRDIAATKWAGVDVDASAARWIANGKPIDGAADRVFDEAEFHSLARRYIGRGRLERARVVLEAALERLPESALLHDILGETYFHMGNTSAARAHYRRSLELAPHNRNAEKVLEVLNRPERTPGP